MNTECKSTKTTENQFGKKPSFFQRMFQKLDDKMKEKAEESSSCCCCSEDRKSPEDSEKCR